jgi:putative ABC transport system permease protein
LLGLERARFFRATATAAMAGIVASLALCIALTVMVGSFRGAVAAWLEAVLPADLYVRSGTANGAAASPLPDGIEAALARLPGVRQVRGARSQPLLLSANQPEVWLQARSLGPHPEDSLPLAEPALGTPRVPGEVGVFVSEAVVSLYGARVGQPLVLPLPGTAGGPVRCIVRGVWRDYARQFGSILIDLGDYQRLTGDRSINELALGLDTGAAPAAASGLAAVEAGVRAQVARLGGVPEVLNFASTAQLKSISLKIFDRSFAVTRYLQAVAIAIGLAGVAASLSAQVMARRREFGLLAHLGLTRGQVMRLVMLETAAWLAAGSLIGLGLGLAISVVLVEVVNPQSFHWTMDLRVPPGPVGALIGAVLVAGLGTALFSARHALSAEAVRAVKEDW